MLAQNFSAALDDLFKLNGIGALEESVEQKYALELLPITVPNKTNPPPIQADIVHAYRRYQR
jgi:hypothetical protein